VLGVHPLVDVVQVCVVVCVVVAVLMMNAAVCVCVCVCVMKWTRVCVCLSLFVSTLQTVRFDCYVPHVFERFSRCGALICVCYYHYRCCVRFSCAKPLITRLDALLSFFLSFSST